MRRWAFAGGAALLFACSSAGGNPGATPREDASASTPDSGESAPDSTGLDGAAVEAAAPYTQALLDHAHIGSDSSMADFQQADAPFTLTGAPFASAKLVVDLSSPCFPWTNWTTDPPPAGQSWPADCDAFDRNFEMSLVDPAAPKDTPAIELVRAISPFGGPEHVEQDVTDVMNAVHGARTFHVTITAYPDPAGKVSGSKGGWYVSAHLELTPGPPPDNVLGVMPVFYGDVFAGQTIADMPLTMPPGTTSGRLEYRVTGHGGALTDAGAAFPTCFGAAEEFCRRQHHVFVDDGEIASPYPWRGNCDTLCTLTDGGPFGGGQYCAQNPCGDPTSVQASRANWCPGSATPPLSWTPSALASPGGHTVRFAIDGIVLGGQWRVSVVAFAYGN